MVDKELPALPIRSEGEPAAVELRDDDLEQVVGGLARHLPGWGAEGRQVPDRQRDEPVDPTPTLP